MTPRGNVNHRRDKKEYHDNLTNILQKPKVIGNKLKPYSIMK